MQQYCTPCYLINKQKFIENCNEIEENFKSYWGKNLIISFSIKTNNSKEISEIVKENNWYAEVVSYDEYILAKKRGFAGKNIVCNGPTKGKMLEEAWKEEGIINIDNLQEVYNICSMVISGKVKTRKVGLRVNFDFESICSNQKENGYEISRFGLCYENGDLETAIQLLRNADIDIAGLHMHTSTRTRSLDVFKTLAIEAVKIARQYKIRPEYIDMGGGFFGGCIVNGKPTMEEYARIITDELCKEFNPKDTCLILEPGASVIATAIDYMTSVKNVREVQKECFVTVDGTLLHINPFMVKRKPSMQLIASSNTIIEKQVICGCTCMEKDVFDTVYQQRELQVDDKIIFKNAGAYTMSFNSQFIIDKPNIYIV